MLSMLQSGKDTKSAVEFKKSFGMIAKVSLQGPNWKGPSFRLIATSAFAFGLVSENQWPIAHFFLLSRARSRSQICPGKRNEGMQ